jgi:hypothetical protein
LDGGFYEAAKYLHNPESKFSVTSALVDVDAVKLNSMLGIHTAGVHDNKPSATSAVPAAAITGIKTVGSLISTLGTNVSKAVMTAAAATTESTTSSAVNTTESAATTPTAETTESSSSSTTTSVPTSSTAAAATTGAPSAANETVATAKQFLTGWGKTVSMFGASSLESLKKGIDTVRTNAFVEKPASSTAATASSAAVPTKTPEVEDADEDDGLGPRPQWDETKNHLNKTDQERAQALALHRMGGLRKGDAITISRSDLPGSKLFPCIKIKVIEKPVEDTDIIPDLASDSADAADTKDITSGGTIKKEIFLSRYLVVSRERLMVLDAHGGGVGSAAVVKSNHHLTEVQHSLFLIFIFDNFFVFRI